jgi:signal peptidase I
VIFRRFAVSEGSMSPLFREGDYLVTVQKRPIYADVIVFEHPNRPAFHLIKRVIGLAGQTVEIKRGEVFVDGQRSSEPWTADDATPEGAWEIPANHVFVLGDARRRSTDDGRTLGPIEIDGTANVVVFRYWPLGRIGRIRRR